jgi:hypothetical protein
MSRVNCLFKIEYTNEGSGYHAFCDLPPFIFSNGFVGVVYLFGHIAETPEAVYEEGEENGEGEFVPSYQRGTKQYILRTGLITQQTVDLLYFLRMISRVELTLLTGEVVRMNRLEVSHEYQFDDKQEATAELRFDLDEHLVATACCV